MHSLIKRENHGNKDKLMFMTSRDTNSSANAQSDSTSKSSPKFNKKSGDLARINDT